MGFARVALVTGSGKRRVGFEVARALGQAGFRVILHYQTSRAEAEESSQVLAAEGIVAEALQADLANEGEALALVKQVLESHGRIDALVTCASRWGDKALSRLMPPACWSNFEPTR